MDTVSVLSNIMTCSVSSCIIHNPVAEVLVGSLQAYRRLGKVYPFNFEIIYKTCRTETIPVPHCSVLPQVIIITNTPHVVIARI